MSDNQQPTGPAHAAGTTAVARPPRTDVKSNGQWMVDGIEPLNPNEVFKQAEDGLEVRRRVETYYSKHGFKSILPTDLNGRLRWWGLYTQRKPGIDGGKTAQLEPHELSDEYFMMRIRLDGGQLTTHQLRVIADISKEFARDTADLTDRQNIQLHWIRVEDLPEIWNRLESNGLLTTEACGDVPRIILGSPLAGIASDELYDTTDIVNEIVDKYVGDPNLSNLPRKFKSAITGHPSQDVVHEINDIAFVAVEHPQHGIGFDLWVGGGLSTAPRLAERLNAWVAPEQVVEVWHGVCLIFRDYGFRRLRNKARLKFLMAEWGPEKFRQILEDDYLGYKLADGPAPVTPKTVGDHVGIHEQKDGKFYIGVTPTVGRVSGEILGKLADLLEKYGSKRLRTTAHQKLVLLDINQDDVEPIIAELKELGLYARPSDFRRSTIACTGIEYCKLAIVDTKDTATATVNELEKRLIDLKVTRPISLHINGCPNSCARIQTADIGLKGQLLPDGKGGSEPGFQVHLGGGLASKDRDEAGLGRTVRGLKVTATNLTDYVENITRRYETTKVDDETFAEWAHRVEESELQ